MGNQELIHQANQLPDNDGYVDPFFQNREALQIRINALSRAGNLSAKKAIYILQNAQYTNIKFPLELAAQIYFQLNTKTQDPIALSEKLQFVKSLFSEPDAVTERIIAHGVLDKKPSNTGQPNGQNTKKDEIDIFNFQLIVNHVSTQTLLSHENWQDWLIRVTEICVLNIDSLRDPSFNTFLETATNAIKGTLSNIDEYDKHKLIALLSAALFNNFPVDAPSQLQKVVELSIELGISEAEKNIRWQQILQNPTPDIILRFSKLFEGETPSQLAMFVTRTIPTFPERQSHSRIGSAIANLIINNDVDIRSRKAIVDELSDIYLRFINEIQTDMQIDGIDEIIKSLISNLGKVSTKRHQAESELRDYLVQEFKGSHASEILKAKLVDGDSAIILVAECLDTNPDFVNSVTSQSNGLELLSTLRQLRLSFPVEQSRDLGV